MLLKKFRNHAADEGFLGEWPSNQFGRLESSANSTQRENLASGD